MKPELELKQDWSNQNSNAAPLFSHRYAAGFFSTKELKRNFFCLSLCLAAQKLFELNYELYSKFLESIFLHKA